MLKRIKSLFTKLVTAIKAIIARAAATKKKKS